MPDPVNPTDPAPPAPPPMPETEASARPTSTELPSNVAAALACFPLIGGIVFYILEKRDGFVRFYAMQSIVFGLAWLLFNIASAVVRAVFWTIPGIGGILVFFWSIVNALVQIAFLIIWIVATVKAFMGVRWEIPYIGPIARKHAERRAVL